jgi:molybdenum cofactor synthesis domain-containing protein
MISCAILTVSDTRSANDDTSGDTLDRLLIDFGCDVVARQVVTDDEDEIVRAITRLSDLRDVSLLITTGGTGLSPRDNTPEATRKVLDREAAGIAEAMRREGAAATPKAMLSRGTAGTRGRVLIINLPGSPKAVEECFAVLRPVLKHAIAQVSGLADHG